MLKLFPDYTQYFLEQKSTNTYLNNFEFRTIEGVKGKQHVFKIWSQIKKFSFAIFLLPKLKLQRMLKIFLCELKCCNFLGLFHIKYFYNWISVWSLFYREFLLHSQSTRLSCALPSFPLIAESEAVNAPEKGDGLRISQATQFVAVLMTCDSMTFSWLE